MSRTPPYLRFFVADFLSSSRVLSMPGRSRGLYAQLLFLAFQAGEDGLPGDERALMRSTGYFPDEWEEDAPPALDCFEERDGRLYHPRVEEELEKVAKAKDAKRKQSEAGKRGGRKRWAGTSDAERRGAMLRLQAKRTGRGPGDRHRSKGLEGCERGDPSKALEGSNEGTPRRVSKGANEGTLRRLSKGRTKAPLEDPSRDPSSIRCQMMKDDDDDRPPIDASSEDAPRAGGAPPPRDRRQELVGGDARAGGAAPRARAGGDDGGPSARSSGAARSPEEESEESVAVARWLECWPWSFGEEKRWRAVSHGWTVELLEAWAQAVEDGGVPIGVAVRRFLDGPAGPPDRLEPKRAPDVEPGYARAYVAPPELSEEEKQHRREEAQRAVREFRERTRRRESTDDDDSVRSSQKAQARADAPRDDSVDRSTLQAGERVRGRRKAPS